jgi:hypothetical protein
MQGFVFFRSETLRLSRGWWVIGCGRAGAAWAFLSTMLEPYERINLSRFEVFGTFVHEPPDAPDSIVTVLPVRCDGGQSMASQQRVNHARRK